MEQAKDQIRPYRDAAMEIYRPGAGLVYVWVTFEPAGGGVHLRAQSQTTRVQIKTEKERPSADVFFNRSRGAADSQPGGFDNSRPTPRPSNSKEFGQGPNIEQEPWVGFRGFARTARL